MAVDPLFETNDKITLVHSLSNRGLTPHHDCFEELRISKTIKIQLKLMDIFSSSVQEKI